MWKSTARTPPDSPSIWVRFDGPEFLVRRSEAEVQVYSLQSPSHNSIPWPDQPITTDRLLSLAASYAALGDIPIPLHVFSYERASTDDAAYQVDYIGTYRGVPLMTNPSSYVQIDPANGRLLFASYRKPPTPPSDLLPATSGDQARNTYLSYLFSDARHHRNRFTGQKFPYRLTELSPPMLCVYAPTKYEQQDEDSFYTSEQVLAASQGRGTLVWFLRYDVPPMVDGAPVTRKFDGFVDAKTGRLLRFNEYWPMGGGGTIGPKSPPRHAPLHWDMPSGKIGILSSGKWNWVPAASVSFVKERASPKEPRYPIVLSFGQVVVPCSYDAKTNLLATGMLGRESLGRPSPNLAQALRHLKPGA